MTFPDISVMLNVLLPEDSRCYIWGGLASEKIRLWYVVWDHIWSTQKGLSWHFSDVIATESGSQM